MSFGNSKTDHLLKLDEWGKWGAEGIKFKVALLLLRAMHLSYPSPSSSGQTRLQTFHKHLAYFFPPRLNYLSIKPKENLPRIQVLFHEDSCSHPPRECMCQCLSLCPSLSSECKWIFFYLQLSDFTISSNNMLIFPNCLS